MPARARRCVSARVTPCSRGGDLPRERGRPDGADLNGYDHSRRPLGPQHRIRRTEVSALPAHEAALRLATARWVVERAGLEMRTFAPPGWRASAGTLVALSGRGFAACADEAGVHLLGVRAAAPVRSRLIAFETGPRGPETMCARLLLAKTARTVRRGGLVRLAVRGDDVRRPERRDAILSAVDLTLGHGAVGATYASVTSLALAA